MTKLPLQSIAMAIVVHAVLTVSLDFLLGFGLAPASFLWQILSSALIVFVLSYIVLHAAWTGRRLIAILVLLQFGVGQFNTMIEALFFHLDIPKQEALLGVTSGLLIAVVFSPILVRLLNKFGESEVENPPSEPRTPLRWLGTGAAVAVLYFFLYFVAGMLVFPFVKDFYADKQLPGLVELLCMQLFRGTVYLLVCLPVIRTMTVSRTNTALTIGAALAILGGVAPLLLPNPYMPDYVRLPHAIEVGVSNFVFGFLMARLVRGNTKELSIDNRQSSIQ